MGKQYLFTKRTQQQTTIKTKRNETKKLKKNITLHFSLPLPPFPLPLPLDRLLPDEQLALQTVFVSRLDLGQLVGGGRGVGEG